MAELFLEILSEEIPAKMQESAREKLDKELVSCISENFSIPIKKESWITPRRIGFYYEGFDLSKVVEEGALVRGPKKDAPKAALDGFLNKHKAKEEDLTVEGEYYYLKIQPEASDPKQLLKQIIEKMIREVVWPKSMRWNEHTITWVRPLQSILCLLDNKVLPIQFGHITAGNTTLGHGVHSSGQLVIQSYQDYLSKLDQASVVLDANKRKEIILQGVDAAASKLGLSLIEDKELLDEIAGLVEFPVVYLGSIDAEFMSLPKEVMIITLKHHQRYLMLRDKNGNIAPYYIIVSNVKATDGGEEIIKGNNKVLRARLSDAKFFIDTDKQHTLASCIDKLKGLTFHQKIGSVYDKIQRIKQFGREVAKQSAIDEEKIVLACELAKADLVSNMVREFPELQGIVGYYYAICDGIEEDVAIAIKEHYKPQGPSDSLPSNQIGAIVAIADKLDTLNQMFAIGIKPTGSKDPFALRRAAIGIIRIMGAYPELQRIQFTLSDIRDFMLERLKVMRESGQLSTETYEVIYASINFGKTLK